jgi:predicted kinase
MGKIRLSFCKNTGNEKGKETSSALVDKDYDKILTKAKDKLKIKSKTVKLFLANKINQTPVGYELNKENINCLSDGAIICVSLGEAFALAKDKRGEYCTISCPFVWTSSNQHPQQQNEEESEQQSNNNTNNEHDDINKFKKILLPHRNFEMNNQFPILEGNILPYLKEITRENNSIFVEKDFGNYSSFDYKSSTTPLFPNPKNFNNHKDKWIAGLKRECRGLIVCNTTGNILARRFHKFFNVNENEEANITNINLTPKAYLTTKIDGSLVSPFILHNETVWATRGTIQDTIQTFISKNDNIQYNKFSKYCIENLNSTPLFEWCESDRIVGVMEHKTASLILLSIRNMKTGDYMPYSEMCSLALKYNIPYVNKIDIEGLIEDIVKQIIEIPQIEGSVLRLENNDMFKIKTVWYTSIAQASKNGSKKNTSFLLELIKKRPVIYDIPIYRIYEACLDPNFDDHISMCCTLLVKNNAKRDADYLQYISIQFMNAINNLNHKIINWIENEEKKESNETIIQAMINTGWPNLLAMIFVKSKHGAKDILIRKIKEKCTFCNYQEIEELLQISFEKTKIAFPKFNFEITPEHIQEHILEKYLPAKIANYLGISISNLEAADRNTMIQIPSNYSGSEGKIKGMWEKFVEDGIIDLRLDLQPPTKTFNEHYGDSNYAHWQVQYGVNEKCRKSSGTTKGCENIGSFAGVLIPTNKNIPYNIIKEAFKKSLTINHIIQINKNFNFEPENKNNTSKKKYILFCDLDGVLVNFDKGVFDITSRYPSQFSKTGEMWKEISKKNNFWANLDWTSDGNELWNFIQENKDKWDYQILTGIPEGKNGADAKIQKPLWCQSKLDPNISVNTCSSKEKHKFSNKNHILIDDRLEYKEKWISNGGIFIHHINTNNTIESLRNLIECNHYTIPSDIIVMVDDNQENQINFLEQCWNPDTKIMAFDVEWRTDDLVQSIYPEFYSLPSLLQISFNSSDKIFLIDCLHKNDTIFDAIINILKSKNITKICFGIKEDLSRIIALIKYYQKEINIIQSIIDLHEIFSNKLKIEKIALKVIVQKVLGLQIEKNKSLQVSDWELRPLSLSQQKYAAMDAHILMKIYANLTNETGNQLITQDITVNEFIDQNMLDKYIFSSLNSDLSNKNQIYNITPLCRTTPSQKVNFEYLAIFLTTQSRNLILELFPPLYINRYTDHITLIHKSETEKNKNINLNDMNLGNMISFQIVGKCADQKCQTLIIKLSDDNHNNNCYHLTISTVSGIPPSYSSELVQKELELNDSQQFTPIQKTTFTGKIGLLLSLDKEQELLIGLQENTKKIILDLVENNESSKIRFKGGTLSSNERKIIHDFADHYNLISESEGPKDNRQLILTKPHKWTKPNLDFSQNEKEKIIKVNSDKYGKKQKITTRQQEEMTFRLLFDTSIFNELSFKNLDLNNSNCSDGKLDLEKGIIWNENSNNNPNTKIIKDLLDNKSISNLVIILRGLPGSGKSTLCNMISQTPNENIIICSADHFFTKLKYFDENRLHEAHDYCRDQFIDALNNKVKIIIIDNTNITLDRYAFYKRKAKEYNRNSIVIEMSCHQQSSYERNVHQIPIEKINKMHKSWENDTNDNIIRIETNHSFGLSKSDCIIPKSRKSLSQFINEFHCIHNSHKKPQTYLLMSVGDQPTRYLHIPNEIYDQFLECYAADTNQWFISEYAHGEQFKFFIDIDYLGNIKLNIIEITNLLQDVLIENQYQNPLTLITGVQPILRDNNNLLQGYHLRCSNVIVTEEIALKLREQFISKLNDYLNLNWNKIIDKSVIIGRSLRMLWSRKTQKGVDVGRVQSLVSVIENKIINNNKIKEYQHNSILLLKDVSVRVLE